MRLEASATPAFARHESFHPRYGWMKKAVDGATADPRMFTRDDAVVQLGVGKNMVRSIRFWGLATKLLTQEADPERLRMPKTVPSRIGVTLFGGDGWDPYCEDRATLWLLHWWLLAPPSLAPAWWVTFHEFPALDFGDDDLRAFVSEFVDGVSDWDDVHSGSLKKDIDCLLRMYTAEAEGGRPTSDDLVDCPFRELGLLRPGTGRRRYRFVSSRKPGLPSAVVLFAALDFVARTDTTARTVTMSRLATEPGGPGRAFRISEQSLIEHIEQALPLSGPRCRLITTTGVTQLTFDGDPAAIATKVLHAHYLHVNPDAQPAETPIAGTAGDEPASIVTASSSRGKAKVAG
ncbi:MAG TPA: DUF4007 family protein [Mycobacteriales bacterium]|nr:DUF4007 family protein [Mycobacteriales bacterium]